MIVKPICGAYDINRKFGFNATEAITIEHEEDFKTRYIDLFLYEGNTRNAVDVSGATVTARMVTSPEFNSLLLNDNVSCSIGEKLGHIIIPIDKSVLPSYPCEFLVEIHIESGENVLVLPFPLWVRMNASILDGAGVTPESKGTVPELLEEATQALEAAEQAIETSKDYDSLNNKPSINGVTLSSNKTADDLNLQEKMVSISAPYINIVRGNQIQFSEGLVLKTIENLPAISHFTANAFFEVDNDYYLNYNRQYLPEGSTYGLYIRILGYNVTDYYFDRNGNWYWRSADYQGEWIISDWTKINNSTIQSAEVNSNGTITFTLTDGSTITTTGESVIGPQGPQGAQGEQGVSIVDVNINPENHLIVQLSDGTTIDAGQIGTSKIDIGEAQISIDARTFVYDGNSHVPNVTSVVLNDVQLTYGVDYAVIATPATNAGDYVITVNGIGDYDGTATVNWYINKAQAIINGDDSITIRGIGESFTKTYTTNGDGAFSFTASGGVATVTNVDGVVTVTSTEIGSGILTVTVAEGQNYLSAEKTVNITVQEAVAATIFGVMWDYSLSSPELTRLTPQTDPLGVVTTIPTQEPTACVGTEGGQSDFDNFMPWFGMQRYNYLNGEIVDFVDYTNGETYVYIPEFWSKIVDDSENQKMYFYISDSELNGFTKHLGSGRYVGRYVCGTDYKSISNSAPNVDKTIGEFRTALKVKDSHLSIYDIHTYNAIQLLYMIEYANFNSQDCIGMGIVAGSIKNSGATDILTYHTGRVDGTNNQSAIQYRWMENPWGNAWQYVDGVLVNNYNVYICNDVNSYSDSLSENYIDTGAILPNSFGYVRTLTDYNNGYIFPHYTSGGSDSTYICDYYYGNTGLRIVTTGGTTSNGTGAGLFFWSCYGDSSGHSNDTTARSMLILNNGGNE